MSFENIKPTKLKILIVSSDLFSQKGYENTTLDEIAFLVGIKKASIFNHFSSKRSILDELYKLYETERHKLLPDLNKLLELVETEPPLNVLEKTTYNFPSNLEPFMNCIVSTAAHMMATDIESQKFILKNVLNAPDEHVKPLLYKMIELNRIEKFDVEMFCEIVRDYCFVRVAYIATPLSIDKITSKEKLCFLFKNYVKPIKK